jgi:hypothetical protein
MWTPDASRMEVFHDPFFTGFFTHQINYWEVHVTDSIAFSLNLNMSLNLNLSSLHPNAIATGRRPVARRQSSIVTPR